MASLTISSFFAHKFPIQVWRKDLSQKWTNFKTDYLNKRIVIQAAYYILVGGTAVGLISTIAVGIIQQYSLLAGSIAIALTNGIGAYTIKRLKLEKTIEETNPVLIRQTQELSQIIVKETQLYQQLSSEIFNLKSTLQNHKQKISDKQTEIKNCIDRIEKLTTRIEISEAKLSKLNSLQIPISNTVSTFVKFTHSFLTSNEQHSNSSKQLLQETQAGHIIEDALKNEGANFNQSIKIVEAIFRQATEVLNLLIQQVQAIQNNHEQALKQTEIVNKELDDTQKANVNLEQQIIEIQDKKIKIQGLIDKLNKRMPPNANWLNDKMNVLQAENMNLKNIIKSKN